MMHRFQGIYAPIATPFVKGEIDWDALKHNIDFYNKSKLAGLVVLGSNGEFAMLTYDEKVELVSYVRKYLCSDKKIIAGSGCESTRETIQLSNSCADVGADAALVVTPWYYKDSYKDDVLKAHYTAVADACIIPVMLYNMPRNAGVNMSSSLVCELAKHPNIAGVKDSSGDIVQITNIINGTPADFSVFAGSASFLYATLALGGVGGTLAVANVLPDLCVSLMEAVQGGRHAEAVAIQCKLMSVNAAVTSRFGIPGLKKAMDLIGLKGGEPRMPLQPLDDAKTADLKKILAGVGLL